MKTSRVLLLLSSLVLVTACGTKGPLVLPSGEAPKRAPGSVELPGSADAARDDATADAGAGGTVTDARPAEPAEPPTDE